MTNPTPERSFRKPTDDDMDWIVEHEREVQELRETQLERDGHVYDSVLKMVEIADGI